MLSALYEKVQKLFYPDDEAAESTAVPPTPLPSFVRGAGSDGLTRYVEANSAGKLTTGMLSLVGLQTARQLLGDDWSRVEADLNRITGLLANGFPEAGEVALQYDAETTLFGLDPDGAEERLQAVADAMQSVLDEQMPELAGTVAVDHFVADVPAEALNGADDLAACILANLNRIRADVQQSGRDRSGLWMRSTRLLFQPMWDPRSVCTGPNRCVLELAAGGSLAQLAQSGDADVLAEATARHDFIILSKAIEALHQGVQNGKPCRLLVPVHFGTLTGVWRGDYLKMCTLVPRVYRRHLQVELVGVPAGAGTDELVRLRTRLRLLTESLVVQLDPAHPAADLGSSGVDGLSLSFADMGRPHAGLGRALVGLTKYAYQSGLSAYATGVTTIGHALAAREAGFSLIGGTAIHPTLDAPRPQTRYSPLPHAARWSPGPAMVR